MDAVTRVCRWASVLCAIVFVVALPVHAGDSILRVACDADSEGAEISINGQFKGQCPVDITQPAGALQFKAEKKQGENHLGFFEREIRLGDGVIQRVNVVLVRKLTERGRQLATEKNRMALEVFERDSAEYQKALLTRQTEVRQCATAAAVQQNERMMNCWTHSGGCVGPWPCENSDARMKRCSSNGKGYFEESEFINACSGRIRQPVAPVRPTRQDD